MTRGTPGDILRFTEVCDLLLTVLCLSMDKCCLVLSLPSKTKVVPSGWGTRLMGWDQRGQAALGCLASSGSWVLYAKIA